MNFKDNKGLSMIVVVIVLAIIIAVIIESVIIVSKWIKKEELEDLTTVMLLIQARTKTYSDKEIMKETEDKDDKAELKGILIKDVDDNTKVNELIDKEIISKEDKYYLLSKQDLEELHVYDIKDSDVFLVNYETEEVIYANGIKKDGKMLYKLSEIKENTTENENNNPEE